MAEQSKGETEARPALSGLGLLLRGSWLGLNPSLSASSARASLLHVLCPLLCHPNPFDPSLIPRGCCCHQRALPRVIHPPWLCIQCWPCRGRPASLQQRQPHQDDAGEPKASWLALKSLGLSFPWGWDSVGERTPSPRPSGWTPLAVRPGCARLKSPLTKAQFRVAAE